MFAHHKTVLNALEQWAARIKNGALKYIRIDGQTPTPERARLVNIYQSDPTYRVAFLSMTAAGQGKDPPTHPSTHPPPCRLTNPFTHPSIDSPIHPPTHPPTLPPKQASP